MNRKTFLQKGSMAAASLLLPGYAALAAEPDAIKKLVVLHTNDVHSRLEPFPMDGSRNQGLGGVAARSALIKNIRNEGTPVLLLDAGDIFQGTPYFNVYKGEPEIKAMTQMGYDACTMGNHDFDGGMENFATQLRHASFPVIICNYGFAGTPLENKTVPYKIITKDRLKIGILGVGIKMEGLVPDNLFGATQYLDPVEKANETAQVLKTKEKCDLIICLSHLGYEYKDNKVSDKVLAKETEHIDLIIGGHTHTFMDAPEVIKNKNGADVIVNQVGWAGIQLGRLDFEFSKKSGKKLAKSNTVVIGKKSGE
jgi:5'-nucleotidase